MHYDVFKFLAVCLTNIGDESLTKQPIKTVRGRFISHIINGYNTIVWGFFYSHESLIFMSISELVVHHFLQQYTCILLMQLSHFTLFNYQVLGRFMNNQICTPFINDLLMVRLDV